MIDGSLLPDAARLFFDEPLWRNFFENALTVQFDHRMLAYVLLSLRSGMRSTSRERWTTYRCGPARWGSWRCCWSRSALGIATLLYSVPIVLALAHQGVAIAALAVAVLHAANLTPRRAAVRARRGAGAADVIELTHHADIAILRMAHGKANAMSTEFCRALTARLEELRIAPARAVILTGTGRIFSAGVDLPRLIEGGAPYIREFLPALNEMLAAVFSYPKPVVAAINGHAIAGGCVLACAADRRLMAKEAGRIGVTELLVGVPFPAAAMEIMRHATAPQYFEHAIFSGATFTPEEAIVRGLVDEIVEPSNCKGGHQRGDGACRAVAGRIRLVQTADPSAGTRTPGAGRPPHRRRGHADLVRARHARSDPGLRRAHAEEGLSGDDWSRLHLLSRIARGSSPRKRGPRPQQ